MTHPTALLTDFYQLTMLQGYWKQGMEKRLASFDLFFRKNPFQGGYTVIAGLEEALSFLENLRFTAEEISYLRSLSLFEEDFLDHLKDFRFTGNVSAQKEGNIAFPGEPVLRIEGHLGECQLVETALLNMVNFQSLIATKAARICQEAGRNNVVEFGLRRAQGQNGALSASRAAYIGGCIGTSNMEAGREYGIPVKGTHAHSWVMAFGSELEAFRAYSEYYPKGAILLVDTYDTLKSGVPNAITVGLEMKQQGRTLFGIRIDSGDLAYLSTEARKMLDAAGLPEVKIVASNDLDEHIIHDLKSQGARIDMYGIGTRLVTADGSPALSGVYKLAALCDENGEWKMKLKVTDNIEKSSLPGRKQVWRFFDSEGFMMGDIIDFEDSEHDFPKGIWGHHPIIELSKKFYEGIAKSEPLLSPVMKEGRRMEKPESLEAIRNRLGLQLERLHPTMRRILNPHIYKVSLGSRLHEETKRLRG